MVLENKFFNMLYDDLVVKGLYKEDIKPKDIKDKINRVNTRLNEMKLFEDNLLGRGKINLIKQLYYDKYVIKREDIPESYFKSQERLVKDRGIDIGVLMDFEKDELASRLIMDQKYSLEKWLDYLFSDDAKFYPYYLKYWAFQGMLKLGKYDNDSGRFGRRTKGTVSVFAELNIEALALAINKMGEYLKEDFLDDDELKLVLSSSSFEKLYTYYFNKVSLVGNQAYSKTDGVWVKYDKGSDHEALVKSLEGMGTGWCTASMETAKGQLSLGDFYVYYTIDSKGNYTVPRLAIRMEGDNIAEVRGIAKNQEIEDIMHDVIEKKLEEFPDCDLYLKKVSDMKKMTNVYKKYENGIELNCDELRFLYQVDDVIVGFGYGRDPRILEILSTRDKRYDFSIMYNCREDQIAMSLGELINNNEEIVCCFENIIDKDIPLEKLYFPKLKYVAFNVILRDITNANCFKQLEYVGGNFICDKATFLSGVNNLWYIGLDARFEFLEFDCFDSLRFIGDVAKFGYLENINGIRNDYIRKKIDDYREKIKKYKRR